MEKLRNATLVFLIKKDKDTVSHVCLALKKRGFGINRWNGVDGKVEGDESIEDAAIRETKEEINVEVKNLEKVAELSFYFPHNVSWNQMVHVYFALDWIGEPEESEEMRPDWFKVNELPFKNMWPDDIYWLQDVLRGKLVRASFVFGKEDVVQNKEINFVSGF